MEKRALKILRLQENRHLTAQAAAWFHAKWGIPKETYLQSMQESFSATPVPRWYVVKAGEEIVAGAGVIQNDFHKRTDLTPNLCAVYVEEAFRGRGIAGELLDFICEDCRADGIGTLYLVTEHTGFYERYGWQFYCMAEETEGGHWTRVYVHKA